MKTIALVNQKGGVGKTTSCLNLGAALAQQGKKVLLIDADPQGNLTLGLGYEPQGVTLAELLEKTANGEIPAPEDGIVRHKEGLDFIPGGEMLTGLNEALGGIAGSEILFRKYLCCQQNRYDFVLIDTMPSLGRLTVNVLTAANSVIIPTQAKLYDIQGLQGLITSIARVRKKLNPTLKIEGILFTMLEPRANLTKEMLEAVRKSYGGRIRIFESMIPRSIWAAKAVVKGKSVLTCASTGKAALSYQALAKEVLTENEHQFKHKGAR